MVKNILIMCLVVVASLGIALSTWLPWQIGHNLLINKEWTSIDYIKMNAERNIPEEAFSGGDSFRPVWERFVTEFLTRDEILNVRAYDKNGDLIYLTGEENLKKEKGWTVLKTGTEVRVYGDEEPLHAMRLFTPLYSNNFQTMGFLEVVQNVEPIYGQIKNIRAAIGGITLFLLFILSLILYKAGRREPRSLEQQNISHRLRTPLTSIEGFATTLLEDKSITESEREELLKIIIDESNSLNQQINELLSLTSMERSIYLNKKPVKINALIKESVNSVSKQAENRKIKLETKFPREIYEINVDKEKMIQAMGNLLIASVMRSMAGGKVSLEARAGKDEIEFEIKDDGEEIPREDLPHIFNKFNWVENQQIQKVGSGLGLPLAKAVVEAHGGKINIENLKEKGAKFSVSLPAGK